MTKTTQSKTVDQPTLVQAAEHQVAAVPPLLTKRDMILALLVRPDGASLDEMVEATGWLPHTTRAMLTGLKKKGHPFTSDKVDGVRRYSIVEGTSA